MDGKLLKKFRWNVPKNFLVFQKLEKGVQVVGAVLTSTSVTSRFKNASKKIFIIYDPTFRPKLQVTRKVSFAVNEKYNKKL